MGAPARRSSRRPKASRVVGSHQWRSSISRTSGRCRLSPISQSTPTSMVRSSRSSLLMDMTEEYPGCRGARRPVRRHRDCRHRPGRDRRGSVRAARPDRAPSGVHSVSSTRSTTGRSTLIRVYEAHEDSTHRWRSEATSSRTSRASRDLPTPGSPVMRTAAPWPSLALSHRLWSTSSSSTRPIERAASARRHFDPGPGSGAAEHVEGIDRLGDAAEPRGPRGNRSNLPSTRAMVAALATTVPGSATPCNRADTLRVSPTAIVARRSAPPSTPTTAWPLCTPTRTARCSRSSSAATASTIRARPIVRAWRRHRGLAATRSGRECRHRCSPRHHHRSS